MNNNTVPAQEPANISNFKYWGRIRNIAVVGLLGQASVTNICYAYFTSYLNNSAFNWSIISGTIVCASIFFAAQHRFSQGLHFLERTQGYILASRSLKFKLCGNNCDGVKFLGHFAIMANAINLLIFDNFERKQDLSGLSELYSNLGVLATVINVACVGIAFLQSAKIAKFNNLNDFVVQTIPISSAQDPLAVVAYR